jgi:hypothetical protein
MGKAGNLLNELRSAVQWLVVLSVRPATFEFKHIDFRFVL